MRKVLSLLTALAMLAVMACPVLAESEPTEISFTLWGTNEGLTSVFSLVDMYNESQSDVKVTVNGIDPSVYFEKLNAFFASGSAPDVIQVAADYGDQYTSKGVFAPLNDYITADLQDQWPASLLDALTFDDNLYAIPIGVQVGCFAYNKKLFDEAGVAYPTKDWTEEDFLATVKALTKDDQYGVLIAGSMNSMLRNIYGDYVYDAETKTMTATDNESFKHGLEMAFELFDGGYSPRTMSTTDIGGGFETGKYPLAYVNYWDLDPFAATIGDSFDWDIVQFPLNETYNSRWLAPLFVQALSITETSGNKDAAFDFIKWWATQEAPQTSMSDSFPVATAINSSEAYLNSFPAGHTYNKQVLIDTINENTQAWWNTGVIAEVNNNVITPAFQKLFLQTEPVTVDETIEFIQQQGQQIFDLED